MTDRGVSTAMGYVLMIGVAGLLLATLTLGVNGLVDRQDERTAQAELEVYGERLAADISTADRLAQRGNATTVNVTSDLPETVSGHRYEITFDGDPDNGTTEITMDPDETDRTVEVGVTNSTVIAAGEIRGGTVRISYDPVDDVLEVEND